MFINWCLSDLKKKKKKKDSPPPPSPPNHTHTPKHIYNARTLCVVTSIVSDRHHHTLYCFCACDDNTVCTECIAHYLCAVVSFPICLGCFVLHSKKILILRENFHFKRKIGKVQRFDWLSLWNVAGVCLGIFCWLFLWNVAYGRLGIFCLPALFSQDSECPCISCLSTCILLF